MERVKGMGFDQVAAETTVQRAFGWGAKARAYWRHEKVRRTSPYHRYHCRCVLVQLSAAGLLVRGCWC